jgi:hypothetical protein
MGREDGDAADQVHGRAEGQSEGEEAESPRRSHTTSPLELNRANLCTDGSLLVPSTERQHRRSDTVVPTQRKDNTSFPQRKDNASFPQRNDNTSFPQRNDNTSFPQRNDNMSNVPTTSKRGDPRCRLLVSSRPLRATRGREATRDGAMPERGEGQPIAATSKLNGSPTTAVVRSADRRARRSQSQGNKSNVALTHAAPMWCRDVLQEGTIEVPVRSAE